MKTSASIILFFLAFMVYSCTKSGGSADDDNNPPPPPGGNNCDTANMKYATNIVPILQNNCYRCHGSATSSGSLGIVLEGYDNIRPYAESGTLIGVITHATGYTPMPGDGGKLSDCDINKVRSWIDHGFQDN